MSRPRLDDEIAEVQRRLAVPRGNSSLEQKAPIYLSTGRGPDVLPPLQIPIRQMQGHNTTTFLAFVSSSLIFLL
jgi:hypothetical protein